MRFFAGFVERRRLRRAQRRKNLALVLGEIQVQIRACEKANKPHLVRGLERESVLVRRELDRLCSQG